VYASQTSSPMPTQHSLSGDPLRPYPNRTSTGWNTPAFPGAPENISLKQNALLAIAGAGDVHPNLSLTDYGIWDGDTVVAYPGAQSLTNLGQGQQVPPFPAILN
jgi:hypothetical protein